MKPLLYDNVKWYSKILFTWLIPLFKRGYGKDLAIDDLYVYPKSDGPQVVADEFESIARALWRTWGRSYLILNLVVAVNECVIKVCQPLLVGYVVRYFTLPDLAREVSKRTAYLAVFGICASSIVSALMRHQTTTHITRMGIKARTAMTVLMYKKLLRLSTESVSRTSVGQILNILANDLSRFDEVSSLACYVVIAPIQAITVLLIVYLQFLGIACLGGIFILLFYVPFQGFMGRQFTLLRTKTSKQTDKRVELMSEMVSAMKLIKLCCWEAPMAKKVDSFRRDEMKTIKLSAMCKGINLALYFVASKAMLFASFVVFVLMGGTLDAETLFVTLALFNVVKVPMTNTLPKAIETGGETLVAMRRVQQFLLLDEKKNESLLQCSSEPGKIVLEDFSAKWTKGSPSVHIENLSLEIEPGQLIAVIGPVGSSKSALLNGILGELSVVSGKCSISGTVSYASQESWCFAGTVRDNILLANKFDEKRYRSVIDACSLGRDLQLFADGDRTLVGEKGYALSGGQKARVALARAVYNEADIYLLDDPLATVDPEVANHIFNKCLSKDGGFLAGKTVVLVTHQLHFLRCVDKVIVFNETKSTVSGTLKELCKSGLDFLCLTEPKNRLERRNSLVALSESKIFEGNDADEAEADQKTITKDNDSSSGSVKFAVYWQYLRSGASLSLITLALITTIACQVVSSYMEMWMSAWTKKYDSKLCPNWLNATSKIQLDSPTPQFDNLTFFNTSATGHDEIVPNGELANVLTYTGLMVALFVLSFARTITVYVMCLRSSVNLHNSIFKKLLRAPNSFFEQNAVGKILNRFTRDIGIVDQQFPTTIVRLINALNTVGIVVISAIVNPYMIIPAIILFSISVPARNLYIRTSRDIKRLDATTRSPVYSHIATTLDGLSTIRAFGFQKEFEQQFIQYMEDSVTCSFMSLFTQRAIGFLLDIFALMYICAICLILVIFPEGIPSGNAGLVLSSALLLASTFQGYVKQTTEFENQIISIERVLEYEKLKSEAPLETDPKLINKLVNWPSNAALEFRDMTLQYEGSSTPVLKNITLDIAGGEKIGVVGRTGAGKSSLVTVLFRLVEPNGLVLLDGLDTKSLGLHDLRSSIAIIPQDPVLFSGTCRTNLDPFNEYDDERLWSALRDSHLLKAVKEMPGQLDGQISVGGSNLSAGQRQLLCLARALLRSNKILVLDEATANVDHDTDQLIQHTIKNKFAGCTVLTVAHRLNTIIDMDKVLVLDSGRVVEFDEPFVLLKNRDGAFFTMIEQTGPELSAFLFKAAESCHRERKEQQFCKRL